MRAPKLLPWVARKAGISDELALKLWRRAAGEAEQLTGRADGPEYCGLAVERFLDLVDDEAQTPLGNNVIPVPRIDWMWRHQNRMSMLSVMAAQNTYRFWQQTWQTLYLPKKAA
ncbi:MAG: hypothetical protein RIR00_1257 [Pseudomonadota bacterium]